jgi:cell wall-associated NlpC family hydrolase
VKSREDAVALARSWVGTPYVLGGRIRGAGCDCATLLAEYLIEIGAVGREQLTDLGLYSGDWFHHANSERYLRGLMRFGRLASETICRAGEKAAGGDLALFKVVGSKVFNHGAIVTAWPRGIHAQAAGVREVNLSLHPLTCYMRMDIFDPFIVNEGEANGAVRL